jgi:phospholipid/cholesterol/gamma-HCH transport system substrate-binding protein
MTRTRRRRPASIQRGPAKTVAMALTVVGITLGFTWLALSSSAGVPGVPMRSYSVAFSDLSGLNSLNEIRIAGRRVGVVVDPRLERGVPVVDLHLKNGTQQLPADTRAVVRSKGLLGQRFLDLQVGTSKRMLPSGARIAAARSGGTVQLGQVFDTLDPERRARLKQLIAGTGEGLLGRGEELNTMLKDAPSVFAGVDKVAGAVLDRDGAAARFVPSLASGVGAADAARQDIAAGFRPTADVFGAINQQRQALQQTLTDAPSSLRATRAGLAQTDPLLVAAEHLARVTTVGLRRAPQALRQTRALLTEAHQPLERLRDLVAVVPGLVRPTLDVAANLTPLLPRTESLLTDLQPALRVLGPRECDVVKWAKNWRNMLGFGIANGGGPVGPMNELRLELITGPEALGINSGVQQVGRNPYPAPCEAGTERLP